VADMAEQSIFEDEGDEIPPGHPARAPGGTGVRPSEIAQLFREHNRALVSLLTVRLQSFDEAREVAQEAYARMLQLDKDGTPGFLRFYLFRVAVNLATDRLRQRARFYRHMAEATQDFDGDLNEPESQVLAQDELQRLSGYLKEIPDRCREALMLFRLEELSQEEIAKRLGVTPRMARRYISYALTYCRQRIDGMSAHDVKESLKL
jgi:RNA polymerase sigma factor (sigma-70 family)